MKLLAAALVLASILVVPAAYAATTRPPARVMVTSSEWDYVLSRTSVKQGRAIIQLVNLGEDPHDLAIRRNARGARTYRTKRILFEQEATLSLRLYPGRYTIWCTVGDHRKRGMVAALVVRR